MWQRLLPLIFGLCFCSTASADWINLSGAETSPNIAEIYVLDDRVELKLEIYVGDVMLFEDLVPDDWLQQLKLDRPSIEQRLQHFSSEVFQFITDQGVRLSAELNLVEPRMRTDRRSPFAGMINPYTRQRVPEPPQDKRVLYAELSYPFAQRPDELTIVPPLDEQGRALATIGFIAYHKAVPIIDFRYLGSAAKLFLNWRDPWYSQFENPNLKRHHKDALMSFLYVEPFEVRHEILIRVQDMAQWLDLGLRGKRYIEVDELGPLKQRIGEFLLTKNPLLVDGQALKPILDRTHYVKVGITGIQLLENPERLEISTAIVGVIIAYVTGSMPQEVSVDWQLFSDKIQRVPATAIDPAGPLMTYLTPEDTLHTWNNFLKNYQAPTVERVVVDSARVRFEVPLGSLLCLLLLLGIIGWIWRRRRAGQTAHWQLAAAPLLLLGGIGLTLYPLVNIPIAKPAALAPPMADDEAQSLLLSLLKNVYRAFDFREEEDVYDKLALTVSGNLLSEVYLQNRRSMAIQRAGGAQARVQEVDVLSAHAERDADDASRYAVRSRWTASGTVGHWGHVHTRKNLYDAVVTLQTVDGAWKIVRLNLREETRIDPYAATSTAASSSTTPPQ